MIDMELKSNYIDTFIKLYDIIDKINEYKRIYYTCFGIKKITFEYKDNIVTLRSVKHQCLESQLEAIFSYKEKIPKIYFHYNDFVRFFETKNTTVEEILLELNTIAESF